MNKKDIRKLNQLSKDSEDGNSILGLWIKANENNDTKMINRTMKIMVENSTDWSKKNEN